MITQVLMITQETLESMKYYARGMRRNPGFTSALILTVALGLGANIAIFSFVDALLIRSLPARSPESLVGIVWRAKDRPLFPRGAALYYPDPRTGFTGINFPYGFFETLRTNTTDLSDVFAFSNFGGASLTVLIHGEAAVGNCQYVSGGFFGGLGIHPFAGRLIDETDDRPGGPAVAVIGFGTAKRYFGSGNPLGETLVINRIAFTVVGILPEDFYGPGLTNANSPPDVYLPLRTSETLGAVGLPGAQSAKFTDRNFYWVELMGRLRPGVSAHKAESSLGPLFEQFLADTPGIQIGVASHPVLFLKEKGAGEGLELLRRQYSKPLYVLLSIVILILAIACANIANLLLARAASRRREIAVRLSLGAHSGRVVQQLLTESIFLALVGGCCGILVAKGGIRLLTVLLANGRSNFTLHAELNWHVMGAALGLSVLTGVLFGLVPAIQAARTDVMSGLRDGRCSAASNVALRRGTLRVSMTQCLLVSQVTISLLMVVGAGLFVRSLLNLQSIELGFNPYNVLLFTVNARQAGHSGGELARFYENLQSRLSAASGVRGVGFSNYALLSGFSGPVRVAVPGEAAARSGQANLITVGASFFTTMQIPLILGREIDSRDTAGSRPVGLVSQAFADTYFGKDNPIGRHFRIQTAAPSGSTQADIEIIGVAKNARLISLKRDTPPSVYLPYTQDLGRLFGMVYEVRTTNHPTALVPIVRQIVREADPSIPVATPKMQVSQIDESINEERVLAILCGWFAVLALGTATVGLYATLSYNVGRRSSEIGIRVALGARRAEIVWMFLRETLILCTAGAVIGIPIALATSRFLASLLFRMRATDPMTFLLTVIVLFLSAMIGGIVPAFRASRMDPMTAIRHE